MRKSNLILQAAIAIALGTSAGAQAGTLTGATTFASEVFGPSATSAMEIVPGVVTYTFNTPGGIVINDGGVIYMYFRVANGIFTAAPTTADISGTAITGLGLQKTAVALSTDSTTARLTVTNTSGANITIGVGSTITLTPAATRAFSNVATTLGTVGNSVTLQGAVSAVPPTLPNTGTALPSELESATALNMATSAEGITSAMAASSAFPFNAGGAIETQKIDLTAVSGAATRFTTGVNSASTTIANLGAFRFSNTAGTQANTDGTTDYTLAADAATMSGTVTGSFKTGSALHIDTGANCATGTLGGGTGTLNAGLTTFTLTGVTVPTTATNYYVCLTTPATTGAIPTTTPALSLTVNKTDATDATDTVSGSLYALGLNGAQVDVRSYVPAGNTGYTSWVRVINTGTVAAAITGQFLNQDGTTGTAGTIITSLPAGGSQSMTANQVEAAIGAPTGGAAMRPRLRVTAPTNGMQVQSFISNPDGSITDMTGAQ